MTKQQPQAPSKPATSSKDDADSFPAPTKGDLVIFGTPDRGLGGQAAWFKASEADAAMRSAALLRMGGRMIHTSELALLASRFPIGELNGTARRFAPVVTPSLYTSLGSPPWTEAPQAAVADPKAPAATWSELAAGHVVLVPEEGPQEAWWQALVVRVEGTNATLRWRFDPDMAAFVRPIRRLGLVMPEALT